MSSTISNNWREPEKCVPIAETQRWETDSTGRATRPCKVLEDLSHYFKAENYYTLIFFQIPKHQDSSSKQNSKFSGIPDVKFAFILAKEKKNQCIYRKIGRNKALPSFCKFCPIASLKSFLSTLVLWGNMGTWDISPVFLFFFLCHMKYRCEVNALVPIPDTQSAKDGRAQWRLSTGHVHLCREQVGECPEGTATNGHWRWQCLSDTGGAASHWLHLPGKRCMHSEVQKVFFGFYLALGREWKRERAVC